MSSTDINRMLAEREGPCISIILPTTRYGRGRLQNSELIEKVLLKVGHLLDHSAWPQNHIINVQEKLQGLLNRIDYMRLQEGIAIFISPHISKVHLLPFTVEEKVLVGKTFEIRDLLYFEQQLQPYYLLAISRHRVRLFRGSGRDLQEILNGDFPKVYIEEYEYERPSLGSSSSPALKSFEKDKSILDATRMKTFFKHADGALKKYVSDGSPILIAGIEREIADFEHISQHATRIAGTIGGNYDVDAIHPLAETAWGKIKEYVRDTNNKLLVTLEEYIGSGLAVDGITSVWQAAMEGKGRVLLLEKDYQKRGYTKDAADAHLHLTPPSEKHLILSDAVNEVIHIVQRKGGTVVIFGNGALDKFQHIALLLRYAG